MCQVQPVIIRVPILKNRLKMTKSRLHVSRVQFETYTSNINISTIHLPSSNHGRLTHLVRLVTLPPPDVSIQHRTRSKPGVVTGLFKTYFINTQKIEDV